MSQESHRSIGEQDAASQDPQFSGGVPPGWNALPAEPLPLPTFWPAGLGLATTFIFWGLISSWVVFAVGAGLFAASLGGWIRHLRYERKHHASH